MLNLPDDCISKIISLTSPRDACRFAMVSPFFKSIADSDAVWESFLPSDYKEILPHSPPLVSLSRKNLFFHLCNNHIIFNNGAMSFAIDKETGKKCIMVGAKALTIVWGDTPEYWIWPSVEKSRFAQVAELVYVWWFDVKGMIEAKILSPKTAYVTYFVFSLSEYIGGFEEGPVSLGVYVEGRDDGKRCSLYLASQSQDRGDGWMETEMGEFFNDGGDDETVVCSLLDHSATVNEGLIIEGIEFRPKQ